jgi:hypothetical protein
MRMLRFVCAIAVVCGISPMANATANFTAVVVDPQPTIGEITYITSPNFTITSLDTCQSNQLDGLSPSAFIGCFTGLNLSGKTLTSLQIEFPAIDIPGLGLALPSCPVETQDVFSTLTCGFTDPSDTEYLLSFSNPIDPIVSAVNEGDCDHDGDAGHLDGDDIKCDSASIFTIAIGGIPASDLPSDIGVVANAPEPNSFWLMSTGVLSIGLFGAYRRRLIVGESRP